MEQPLSEDAVPSRLPPISPPHNPGHRVTLPTEVFFPPPGTLHASLALCPGPLQPGLSSVTLHNL